MPLGWRRRDYLGPPCCNSAREDWANIQPTGEDQAMIEQGIHLTLADNTSYCDPGWQRRSKDSIRIGGVIPFRRGHPSFVPISSEQIDHPQLLQ